MTRHNPQYLPTNPLLAQSAVYRYGFNGVEQVDELSGAGNKQDFGARVNDPRTGRWLSLDREHDKAPGWSPYRFGFNSPLKFSDGDGNFEVDPALAKRYPKVALVILNADKLYNNQSLPEDLQQALEGVDVNAIFNDVFRTAFEEWSTLSKDQIQEIIKPGVGPLISVKELDRFNGDEDILVNGKNITEMTKDGIPLDKNIQRNGGKSGELSIDNDVLDVLEFELGGDPSEIGGLAGKTTSISDKVKAFRTAISTLFHEAVHYGRNETGVGNSSGPEPGDEFEKAAFGEDVPRTKKESLENGY